MTTLVELLKKLKFEIQYATYCDMVGVPASQEEIEAAYALYLKQCGLVWFVQTSKAVSQGMRQ